MTTPQMLGPLPIPKSSPGPLSPTKTTTKKATTKETTTKPPRPSPLKESARMVVHYHPHPLKTTNKAHIEAFMASLTPDAPSVETDLYIQARTSMLKPWGFKAPFSARVETISNRRYWRLKSMEPYDALLSAYEKKGYVRATVKDMSGQGVECTIVIVGRGESVPQGAFKIRAWREPLTWLEALLMRWEEERKEKARVKAEREMSEKNVDVSVDDAESNYSWDEKDVKSFV